MPGPSLRALTTATGLALAACASSTPPAREANMTQPASSPAGPQAAVAWPLRFDSHSFSVFTYDTYGAKVVYDDQLQTDEDDGELQRSSASYGPDYQHNWKGIHGSIANFPAAAQVSWRSKDGQAHEARVDLGEIFKDQLIRHQVPREEVSDAPTEPSIILEINDRTINVYMRAFITTKREQIEGNRYSRFRHDLIRVWSRTY